MFGCVWVQIEALPQVFDRAEQPLWLPLLSTLHFPLGGWWHSDSTDSMGCHNSHKLCQICVHFPEELSMNFWITFLRVPSIHHSKGGVLFVFSFFTGIIVVYHCVRCLYHLIKLATSPFYHVWIPCVYPSKGPRLFKVITYFFRKRVNANHNNSWWIKFRVFPNTSKQSQKLKVHEEDINNFGKVPSITTRLYNNDVWRIWEYQYRLERKLTVCAETNDGTFKGGLHNF